MNTEKVLMAERHIKDCRPYDDSRHRFMISPEPFDQPQSWVATAHKLTWDSIDLKTRFNKSTARVRMRVAYDYFNVVLMIAQHYTCSI